MVVMTTGIDLSQELFAVNMLRTLKSSLKHRRKHVLRSLQLYGDQALEFFKRGNKMKMSQQAGSNPRPDDH